MKKSFSTLLLCLLTVFAVQATSADLFELNETAMETQLQQLNDLDDILKANSSLTLEEITTTHQEVLAGITLDVNGIYSPMFGFDDIDWGSFAWGFCCWPVGLFTVILNDNKDRDQKMSYVVGVGSIIVLSIITNVITYAAYGGLFWAY